MFNDRKAKAGQIAAFFVKTAGGRMGVIKLVKLMTSCATAEELASRIEAHRQIDKLFASL